MPPDKLQHVKKVLEIITESLTRKEFLAFAKTITQQVLDLENKIVERLNKSTASLEALMVRLEKQNESALEKVENEVVNRLAKVRDGKDGRDGVDGTNGIDGKDGVNGKDGSPDDAEAIRNKLEVLQGDERLDKSAIKGLDEMEKKLDERIQKVGSQRVVAGPNANAVQAYHFTQDGSKSYNVPGHRTSLALIRTEAPFMVTLNNGFSIVGRNLVIASNVTDTADQEAVLLYIK